MCQSTWTTPREPASCPPEPPAVDSSLHAIMHTDNLVLVAPRPVRIASNALALRPLPRQSPRANLPSEALEEFLSILRPSLFPPQSPPLRARRIPLNFSHERSTSLSAKPLDRLDNVPILREDAHTPAKPTAMRISPRLLSPRPYDDENSDIVAFRTYNSGPLASPISRIHTRNPFQRHPSYEMPFGGAGGLFQAGVSPPPQTPIVFVPNSPTLVPLPPPTPSEFDLDL
ncbi:hypothetical protein EVG20_g5565 [Dentipellis fragilis]|uniref:Uncharacterized protein n=1 Tax=Dentipellis fragilis TaxID=205917 RepID=A0A4Y9YVA4_9AGAM|nr:hypothetical protein EVG20_g5565 [Dentipellis fragilis]